MQAFERDQKVDYFGPMLHHEAPSSGGECVVAATLCLVHAPLPRPCEAVLEGYCKN